MKKLLITFIFVLNVIFLFAQQQSTGQNFPKPKLVIGIVVDQMRYDLLWRFWDQYGNGGFKRLVNEGFLCRDARYNYFLTVTAAGHSADGAFYFDAKTGNWITSTWYEKKLPDWLEEFNRAKHVNDYVSTDWNLLLPRSAYTMCTNDTNAYEHALTGETLPVFPHKFAKNDY